MDSGGPSWQVGMCTLNMDPWCLTSSVAVIETKYMAAQNNVILYVLFM